MSDILIEKPVDKLDVEREAEKALNFEGAFRMPSRFALLNHLIRRDLNNNTTSPTFSKVSKDEIATYLTNPYQYAKQLRDAVIYIYNCSSHFRRLIQYFTSLSDLSYVVSPYRLDTSKAKPKVVRSSYQRVLNTMAAFDVKNQFPKVLTVCLREDVGYYTIWATNDNVTLQQLPSDYCDIATVEGNVCNVSFNFSYFDTNSALLPYYPAEFSKKYNIYTNDRIGSKWQELDSPTSFAIKCNTDILDYPVPPFVGILRELYDLEDYKGLRMTSEALQNYALIVMTLGVDDSGNWQMDLDKAMSFYRNLDKVLPEEVGAVLSPMPIDKISFEKNRNGDDDSITKAEHSIFTAAGVSSLLFNNEKASSNALLLSIKADQAMTFGIVKSLEQAINRYLWSLSYGKNFKVTFLDCSPFNRNELGDAYLKACQYGLPMLSYYAASQGMSQGELDCMNFLEKDVLDFTNRFVPLQSSSTQSAGTGEAGAPQKGVGDISDNGEIAKEGTGDEG